MKQSIKTLTWAAIQDEKEREAKEEEAIQIFAAELLASVVSQNFKDDPYYEGF